MLREAPPQNPENDVINYSNVLPKSKSTDTVLGPSCTLVESHGKTNPLAGSAHKSKLSRETNPIRGPSPRSFYAPFHESVPPSLASSHEDSGP